jgi:hypothetical protein
MAVLREVFSEAAPIQRIGAGRKEGRRSGRKDHLFAAVLLVEEHSVAARHVVEPHTVSDHEAGIDLSPLNPFEQRSHVVLYVALARPDRE